MQITGEFSQSCNGKGYKLLISKIWQSYENNTSPDSKRASAGIGEIVQHSENNFLERPTHFCGFGCKFAQHDPLRPFC